MIEVHSDEHWNKVGRNMSTLLDLVAAKRITNKNDNKRSYDAIKEETTISVTVKVLYEVSEFY